MNGRSRASKSNLSPGALRSADILRDGLPCCRIYRDPVAVRTCEDNDAHRLLPLGQVSRLWRFANLAAFIFTGGILIEYDPHHTFYYIFGTVPSRVEQPSIDQKWRHLPSRV